MRPTARVDSRAAWLAAAARGLAVSGQRSTRTDHGATLAAYGGAEPHTIVRVARVRLVDEFNKRESWLRQTRTFVRGADGKWRLAMGQGVVMYEGPPLDAALHARYAGTYVIEPGRTLTLRWDSGTLLATFPNGAETQIFLASPTQRRRARWAPAACGSPSRPMGGPRMPRSSAETTRSEGHPEGAMTKKRISGPDRHRLSAGIWLLFNFRHFASQASSSIGMPLLVLVLGIVYFVRGKSDEDE
jgi:hypothetical protein